MLRLATLFLSLLAIACDSRAPAPVDRAEREPVMQLRSILSLRANQRTLLATGSGAKVYFAQPDAAPEAGLQCLENTGQVRPTALTPARVLQSLGEADANISLRDIESLPDGRIVGYFSGTSRTRSLSCLVLYEPSGDSARVIVSSDELARESGLGLTLDLADAQLARTGATLWIWLRQVDQSVFLTLDTRALGGGAARLVKPFEQIKTAEGVLKLSGSDVLQGQMDETLWLLRRPSGELWQIGRDGQAVARLSEETRPPRSVMPLLLRASGPAGTSDIWLNFWPLEDLSPDITALPSFHDDTRYPAILFQSKSESVLLDRDHLQTRPAFPTHALRFTRWLIDTPAGDILAYDAMSGEVFRMTRGSR